MRTAVIAPAATDTCLEFIFEAGIFGHFDENAEQCPCFQGTVILFSTKIVATTREMSEALPLSCSHLFELVVYFIILY